jgi:hypothetical protein
MTAVAAAMRGRRPSRSVLAAGALVGGLLLAGCSSPPAAAPGPATEAAPPPPARAGDDATPPPAAAAPGTDPAPLPVGATHVFPDGNAVTVSTPQVGGPAPGLPGSRTLEVTVTIRNGSPAVEDLSRFDYTATLADDRDAPELDDPQEPSGTLAPGLTQTFPVRFALPDRTPTKVTVEVSKADQASPGVDVPGSDEAPGAFVEWAVQT